MANTPAINRRTMRRKIASSDDERRLMAGIDAGKQQRFQGDLTKKRLNSIMGGSAGQREAKLRAKALAKEETR